MNEFCTEYLADARIVHVRTRLEYLATFLSRPHHECIHRTLDVWFRLFAGLT
jgi:hypothetical protein